MSQKSPQTSLKNTTQTSPKPPKNISRKMKKNLGELCSPELSKPASTLMHATSWERVMTRFYGVQDVHR